MVPRRLGPVRLRRSPSSLSGNPRYEACPSRDSAGLDPVADDRLAVLGDEPAGTGSAVPSPSAARKGTIGVSVLTLTNPFFKVIGDTITEEARKHGYDVIVTSGEFDVARQQNQVKDFIVKKVAAIVLCPCDSRSIGPAIEEANAAGIPVFTADIACPVESERSEAQNPISVIPSEVEGPCVSLPPANHLSAATGQTLAQLLKRPEITIERMAPSLRELDPAFFERKEIRENPRESVTALSSEVRNELKSVETEIKYEGYLLQQQRSIDRLKKAEQRAIPDWFDYHSVSGLSREMQETLLKIRPRTLAHASRIPGVTPAAVSLVHVYIEIQAKRRQQVAAL